MFRLTRLVMCVASMVVISCDDDNPTGPSINKADLIGSWSLTKEIYTEQGQQPDTSTFDNEIIFKYTEDNKNIVYYSEGECTGIDTTLYALNGDKISDGDGDRTISIQGNEIIMTYSESHYSSTSYYTKYTGVLPPASWPTATCSDDETMYKKQIKKIKFISTL
jgi:hypothetical protein